MLRFIHAAGASAGPTFADLKNVTLDGQTGWLNGGNASLLNFEYTDPFWVGAWVFVHAWHSAQDNGKCNILSKVVDLGAGVQPQAGWEMRVTYGAGYSARATFYLVSTPTNYMGVTTADFTIPVGQWIRIDCVNTDGTAAGAKIYLNGVSQTLVTELDNLSATIKTSANVAIGSRNGVENFLNGSVEDPIVCNFVPTQGDIDLVSAGTPFNAASATFSGGPALCAWWMGDSDTAPTIIDRKGNVNLTMTGACSITNYNNFNVDPAFYPVSIASLVNWQDAADPTAQLLSGSSIVHFYDKSNSAISFTASGSACPTLVTNSLNGLSGTAWDGTANIMLANLNPTLTHTNAPMSIFIVADADTFAGSPVYPVVMSYKSNGNNYAFGYSNDPLYTDFWWGATGGGSVGRMALSVGAVTGNPHRIQILYNGAGSSTPLDWSAADGNSSETVLTNGGVGTTGTTSCLGSQVSTGASFYLGKIYEILVFSTQLSGSDLTNVQTYLSTKWGV